MVNEIFSDSTESDGTSIYLLQNGETNETPEPVVGETGAALLLVFMFGVGILAFFYYKRICCRQHRPRWDFLRETVVDRADVELDARPLDESSERLIGGDPIESDEPDARLGHSDTDEHQSDDHGGHSDHGDHPDHLDEVKSDTDTSSVDERGAEKVAKFTIVSHSENEVHDSGSGSDLEIGNGHPDIQIRTGRLSSGIDMTHNLPVEVITQ
eukprot:214552_1